MRFVPVLLVSLLIGTRAASADQAGQTPAPANTPAATAPPASTPGQQTSKPAEAGAPFTYDPEGRRDPFVSLIGRGNDPKTQGARPPGVPGFSLMK